MTVRSATAAVAGLIVSSLITWMLATTGLLRGPTLPGFPDPRTESLLLAGAGAVLAGLLGARRALRRPSPTRSAWLGEELIARSDDVVLVEGNAYFLASDVRPGALTPTSSRTVCPWKGIARYYTVAVDGTGIHDAAWSCPQPLPLARRVKGRRKCRPDPDAVVSTTSPPAYGAPGRMTWPRRIGRTATTGTEQRWTRDP